MGIFGHKDKVNALGAAALQGAGYTTPPDHQQPALELAPQTLVRSVPFTYVSTKQPAVNLSKEIRDDAKHIDLFEVFVPGWVAKRYMVRYKPISVYLTTFNRGGILIVNCLGYTDCDTPAR